MFITHQEELPVLVVLNIMCLISIVVITQLQLLKQMEHYGIQELN